MLAGGWLVERTTVIDGDPFASVSALLVEHPFAVAAAFAMGAGAARYLPRATNRAAAEPTSTAGSQAGLG